MITKKSSCALLLAAALNIMWIPSCPAEAEVQPSITGQWFGTWLGEFPIGPWSSPEFPTGSILEMVILRDNSGKYWTNLYIPELGLFDASLPAAVMNNQIAIGNPPFAWGTVGDSSISGIAFVPDPNNPPSLLSVEWQVQKPQLVSPGTLPIALCENLPQPYCMGSAEYCSELVSFSPAKGQGYLNYLILDETWQNQYRSYVRRDLMQLVKYAAAKLECTTARWDYGNFAPLGLGDMSQADGSSPPGHLTHEDGNHIDIAYSQLYASDNLLRPVGRNFDGYLTGTPYALDQWRTALFISYLSEHPNLRYLAVDEQVGQVLEKAVVELESLGWIDSGLAAKTPLIYGQNIVTAGHTDHMHAAMYPLRPLISTMELEPKKLNDKSQGNYITGYVELVDGYDVADIDPVSIALLVNGYTVLNPQPGKSKISDFNNNGVPDLTVKFDRKDVLAAVGTGSAEAAITGLIGGFSFQASNTLFGIPPANPGCRENC